MHAMDVQYHFYVYGEKRHMNNRLYIPSDNIFVLDRLPHKNGLYLTDIAQNKPESLILFMHGLFKDIFSSSDCIASNDTHSEIM
jgi:hypothetical protein